MRIWKYNTTKSGNYIIKTSKDFLISINGNTLSLKFNNNDVNNVNNNSIFQFIDTN